MESGRRHCPFWLKEQARDDLARLDGYISDWLDSEDDGDEDAPLPEWDPLDPDNILISADRSWAEYALCSALNWRHLPEAGGLGDQSDRFLHDMNVISRRMSIMRKARKINESRRKDARKRLGIFGRSRR